MIFSEDLLEQMEDYLNGTMTVEQVLDFEKLINSESDLAEAIEINRKMRLQYSSKEWNFIEDDKNNSNVNALESILKSDVFQDKKNAIQNADDIYFKKGKSKKKTDGKFNFYYILAAAAVLILFFGIFFENNTLSNEEIYSQHNSWKELPSLVSRSEINSVLLSKGENAFFNKDYKLAEEHFSTYVANQEEINVNALLYLGIAQLELENYTSALENFQKVIESNSLDSSKGHWYKALTYLKMEDSKNALNQFEMSTRDSSNFKYNEAKDIIDKLED